MSRGSSEIAKNEENAFLCLGWRAYNSLITKLSCKKDGTECGYWCLFVGLLKAFDTVDHKVLSRKLNHYGIRGIINKWFSLYLCSRQQFVSIGNVPCPVLGPLLFLLYINNLHLGLKYSEATHFVDDTNLIQIGKFIESLCLTMIYMIFLV